MKKKIIILSFLLFLGSFYLNSTNKNPKQNNTPETTKKISSYINGKIKNNKQTSLIQYYKKSNDYFPNSNSNQNPNNIGEILGILFSTITITIIIASLIIIGLFRLSTKLYCNNGSCREEFKHVVDCKVSNKSILEIRNEHTIRNISTKSLDISTSDNFKIDSYEVFSKSADYQDTSPKLQSIQTISNDSIRKIVFFDEQSLRYISQRELNWKFSYIGTVGRCPHCNADYDLDNFNNKFVYFFDSPIYNEYQIMCFILSDNNWEFETKITNVMTYKIDTDGKVLLDGEKRKRYNDFEMTRIDKSVLLRVTNRDTKWFFNKEIETSKLIITQNSSCELIQGNSSKTTDESDLTNTSITRKRVAKSQCVENFTTITKKNSVHDSATPSNTETYFQIISEDSILEPTLTIKIVNEH